MSTDAIRRGIAAAVESADSDIEGAARALEAVAPHFAKLTDQVIAVVGGSAQRIDIDMVSSMTGARYEVEVALAALAAGRSATQQLQAEVAVRR